MMEENLPGIMLLAVCAFLLSGCPLCDTIPLCCCPEPTPTPPPPPSLEPPGPRKVAVLVSTEFAESGEVLYDADAWYDTVLTYCMLRQNGFSDDNIWVLYGHGRDGFYEVIEDGDSGQNAETVHFLGGELHRYYRKPYCGGLQTDADIGQLPVAGEITDLPMTFGGGSGQENDLFRPQQLFECLRSDCDPNRVFGPLTEEKPYIHALDGDDFLFVWWRGHGYVDEPAGSRDLSFLMPGLKSTSASDVIGWVAGVAAGRRLLVFETCHSGCVEDELASTNIADAVHKTTVLFASSGCYEESNKSYEPDVIHGVWSYWVAGTLQGELPNGSPPEIQLPDGTTVTIDLSRGGPLDDVFQESSKATTTLYSDQHPDIGDDGGLAQDTQIDIADPGAPTPPPPLPLPPPQIEQPEGSDPQAGPPTEMNFG